MTYQHFHNHGTMEKGHVPDEDIYHGDDFDFEAYIDGASAMDNDGDERRNTWGITPTLYSPISVTNEELDALRNDTGNHAFVFESHRTVIPKEVTDEDV